jgi:hypothetical protein
MSTPFQVPVWVKRRFTPPKDDSPRLMSSAFMPSSCATAIAAVALATLCLPGIGSDRSRISSVTPVFLSRMTTSKDEAAPFLAWFWKRTSACGFSP